MDLPLTAERVEDLLNAAIMGNIKVETGPSVFLTVRNIQMSLWLEHVSHSGDVNKKQVDSAGSSPVVKIRSAPQWEVGLERIKS